MDLENNKAERRRKSSQNSCKSDRNIFKTDETKEKKLYFPLLRQSISKEEIKSPTMNRIRTLSKNNSKNKSSHFNVHNIIFCIKKNPKLNSFNNLSKSKLSKNIEKEILKSIETDEINNNFFKVNNTNTNLNFNDRNFDNNQMNFQTNLII